jgi:hypothetical protein
MASFSVSYPVGTKKTRDCQYWPTILRSELRALIASELFVVGTNEQNRIIDARWPVGVSQEVIMHMAWRVREWRVDASSFTYTGEEFNPPNGNTWTIAGDLPELSLKMRRRKKPPDVDDPLREVTDERDILGPASDPSDPGRYKTLRNAGVNDEADPADIVLTGTSSVGVVPVLTPPFIEPGGDYRVNIFAEIGVSELNQYVIYDPVTELFYPPFFAGGKFDRLIGVVGNNSGGEVIIKTLPVTPTAIPAETPQGHLTIINPVSGGPNIVIPLGMTGGGGGVHPPTWFPGSGSVELTMTPIKWWPHRNSLGEAIYDEDTGVATGADPLA